MGRSIVTDHLYTAPMASILKSQAEIDFSLKITYTKLRSLYDKMQLPYTVVYYPV